MKTLAPTTLARFATQYERGSNRQRGLKEGHPALIESRTIFPSTVVEVEDSPRLLVGGENQRKIGRCVMKGRWRGMPIFTLTLEERATCPTTCDQWASCYGNNMHFSRRHRHGAELERRLDAELFARADEHPKGFVVRPHILGDFYDIAYVMLWRRFMEKYEALRMFGYTHHDPRSIIGKLIDTFNGDFEDRAYIRFSGVKPYGHVISAITIDDENAEKFGAIICPAQTEKTQCCATCGLCWSTDKTIAFMQHGGFNRGTAGRRPRGSKNRG